MDDQNQTFDNSQSASVINKPPSNSNNSQPSVGLKKPSEKTDYYGIVSIGLSVVFAPAGLVVGLIGASKAKKGHRNPVLSRIGWVMNLVALVFAVLTICFLVLAVSGSSGIGN